MHETHYDRIDKICSDDLTAVIVPKAELLTLLRFAYSRLLQLEEPALLVDTGGNTKKKKRA